MSQTPKDGIAIVGIGLHFPGANDPRTFWHNLRTGVESLRRYSDEELLAAGVRPELLRNPLYVKAGGPLEDMELFDAEFFGFSPKEAAILDPQHRHFYECAWEALEDAGHVPARFAGAIGVFAGCGMNAYFMFNVLSNPDLVDSVGLFLLRHTGNDKDFIATRTSYLFDLKGPSVSIQAACSTSLVATHVACQSLLSGECDLALAGGVTIEVPHRHGYLYREGEVLSPDGHCHAYDHRSKGTVLASGCGVVALRRLEDALADGDRIYAVIRATAVNNDGSGKAGYLAPSVDGQAASASEALALAGCTGDDIDYVEGHGTGTAVGDPIEITALTQAFRETTARAGFCAIGSVKSAIGHLDTAAGVASLIKVALSLQHGEIPPTLSFARPNPLIDFASSPFYVVDRLQPYPDRQRARRACVNSLGVGGTNAFAVLEQAPAAPASGAAARPFQLLSLSARNKATLDAACERLAGHLRANPDVALGDVAWTLQVGRRAFEQRRVLACRDHAEAIALLESRDQARVFTHRAPSGSRRVAFLFPGGGAQYPRMGIDLYASEPEYRQWIDRGLQLFSSATGTDLRPLLFTDAARAAEAGAALEPTALQLPATFIVEYALARLWLSLGIEPVALIGHSMGENTAACLAGVLSFEDALRLVILRGRLVEATAAGGMMSVNLPRAQLEPLLGCALDLAIVNAPALCVASGAPAALEQLAAQLDERGIEWKRLRIPVAGHSRLLDPILAEFAAGLAAIRLSPPRIPFVSNRTGTWITPAQATDPDYWVQHLRHTVDFARGIDTLLAETDAVLLEVGPGTVLTSFARQSPAIGRDRAVLSSMRHPKEAIDDGAFLVTVLGRLWASGVAIDPAKLWAGEQRRRVRLPTYAFNRQRFWLEPGVAAGNGGAEREWPRKLDNLDEWFWVPQWEPAPLADAPALPRTRWLVFMDDAGVGERLVAGLRGAGHEVIRVVESDAYERLDDDTYALSPEHGREGYVSLVHDLVSLGRTPEHVVHLWLCTAAERFRPGSSLFHRNQERGFFSVLFLLQAFGSEGVSTPVRVTVVTTGMQSVACEPLPYPEKATVLGPCRVGPQEFPGLQCATVDVRLPERRGILGRRALDGAWNLLVDSLARELAAREPAATVAWRDGQRFVRRYRKQSVAAAGEDAGGLRQRGVYLITGGLGELGILFAEHLARTVAARLVLVARKGLPARGGWDEWIRGHGLVDPTSRRIQKVRQLEAAGAEVLVVEADVTDVEAMGGALAAARARFGAIHGVIHAAGVVEDAPLMQKDQAAVERVLSPKLQGTLLLDSLFADGTLDIFVAFSSTSAIIAPPGQVDYVAASAFLDAFAQNRRGRRTRTLTIDWGVWQEVGLAAARLRGDAAGDRNGAAEPARHPLFDSRRQDESGRHELTGAWSTTTQWVLDEHRTRDGRALLPGTGYVELARAALAEIQEVQQFELRDLLFFVPLFVADHAIQQIRVRLTPDEQGYRFEVQSHVRLDAAAGGWQTHAQASLHLRPPKAAGAVDLAAIDARCNVRRVPYAPDGLPSVQASRLRFGPRWQQALRQVAFGDGEALATVELHGAAAADCETYGLHPALLDLATGFALELLGPAATQTLWVPIGYDRIRVLGRLPARFHSWVRVRGGTGADDVAAFDVALVDPSGRVLVEAERFSVRRTADGDALREQRAPSMADLELDAATVARRDLSPAEMALKHNVAQGILPAEGWEAFLRVLRSSSGPQVVVSSMDLDQLEAQTKAIARRDDHAGARFERPALDSDYVAPRDEIERTLCSFWEQLLGIDRVGVGDSFFDLGGHSLIAVRLFARIRKTYSVDYPISLLFEAPTIEQCAARIRESIGHVEGGEAAGTAEPRTRYTHLVAMHKSRNDSKTPFFLIAGMFGNVLNLRHLANLIGADRPFYGLQARGLYGDLEPHETFEEMARDYLAELRTVQPRGPYLLGGFSGGGLTAYEMAQQLLADGEEVALLVLLDSILPQPPQLTRTDKLKIHLQEFRRHGLAYAGRRLRNRVRWELEKRQRRRGPDEAQRPHTAFRSELIESAFRRACDRYRLRPYPGRVVLFRPRIDACHVLGPGRVANRKRQLVFADNCWTPWVSALEIQEVHGDHDSMVLDPNVRVLAQKLQQQLEHAEGRVAGGAPAAVAERQSGATAKQGNKGVMPLA